jgi:hypothetical protein
MTQTIEATESLTFDCKVEVSGKVTTIISPQGGKRLSIDREKIDLICTFDDEDVLLKKIRTWGGKCDKFPMTFTRDELVVLRELVKRADSPPEAEPVTAPVPIPEPATVLPPLTPETAVNGLAPPTLTSMANHTATVSIPEGARPIRRCWSCTRTSAGSRVPTHWTNWRGRSPLWSGPGTSCPARSAG